MRTNRDAILEGRAKGGPNMKDVGKKVGPNEVVARDGYVRRITSVATRRGSRRNANPTGS